MNIYVGIDPGAISGAWGAINHNGDFIGCGDIENVNGRVVASLLHSIIMNIIPAGFSGMIAVEMVGIRPNQGSASSAKFMRAVGAIEATAELTHYPLVLVTPQKWKKYHGLIGTEKVASLELARSMFPEASLKRIKDTGRADALLMALWLKDNHE